MCTGNLVDMGGLAFAPATESVLRFTDHMMRTHALFRGAFSGVFPSEAEAEARGPKPNPNSCLGRLCLPSHCCSLVAPCHGFVSVL